MLMRVDSGVEIDPTDISWLEKKGEKTLEVVLKSGTIRHVCFSWATDRDDAFNSLRNATNGP